MSTLDDLNAAIARKDADAVHRIACELGVLPDLVAAGLHRLEGRVRAGEPGAAEDAAHIADLARKARRR